MTGPDRPTLEGADVFTLYLTPSAPTNVLALNVMSTFLLDGISAMSWPSLSVSRFAAAIPGCVILVSTFGLMPAYLSASFPASFLERPICRNSW